MQVVDKYGNTFGQGHLVITTKSGKSKLPVVTVAWGNITGVLANQTDLQDALDLKVPTSRTLTINGVTQDLSVDRTWTISTGITVNTTPITGGTSGRLLFDNAGTVGETDGAHWDTSGFLGIGTTIPVAPIGYNGITINSATNGAYTWFQTGGVTKYSIGTEGNVNYHNLVAGTSFLIRSGGNNYFNLVQSTGNIQIGTTTDAGYKLDVNGTAAIRGITNIIGGTLRIASTGTLTQPSYITSHSDGGWNYTTYTHERGAGVHYFTSNNGSASIFSASAREGVNINVSSLTTGNPFSISGTVNASSAIARGQLINTTLVAAANNDVLVGLDIAPTFTNGAFTGVTNIAARLGGHLAFSAGGDRYIYQQSPATSGSGSNLIIQSASANTSGQGGNIYIYPGSGAGGPGPGKTYIGNQNGWDGIYMTGLVTINNSGPNTGSALQINAGGQNGLNIYWDNLTPFMQYGLVSGRQSRFVNSSSYSFSTNLIIGATVNAGYMLDVNGTARIQNAFTIASSVFNVLSTSSSLFFVDTGSNNYRIANFIGYGGYHPGSGTNNTGDIFSVGANPSSSANGTSFFRLNYNGGNSSGIYGSSGNNVSLAQLNATTLSRLYLTAQGSGLLLQGGTSGNSIISTVADGDNLNLRSEKGTGGGGGGINYLSSINGSNHSHRFFHNNVEQMRLQYSGNLLIGTTTDAGFRLDVNGTARVNGDLTLTNNSSLSWGNGNFVQVNNSNPDWKFYVQSSLILTLGQSQITLGISANTRAFFPSSDNTHDIGQQFARYRHGWLSGQLKVGDATAVNTSAKVQIDSTTQGFLPPRMTNTEMLAIGTPAEGLVVYDLTNRKLCCYDGATWQPLF